MKIGILTFHYALNFGAVLQAYGLQETLKSMGHDVYVIDYRPDYLINRYKLFNYKWHTNFSVCKNLLFIIRNLIVMPQRLIRKQRFESFQKRFINLYPPKFETNDFDAYVIGSDQVWNPYITGFDKVYLGLGVAAKSKKIVSYAVSVGSVRHLEHVPIEFFSQLGSFTAISVREQSLADYINKRLHQTPIAVTIDPVLLAGRTTFEAITGTSRYKRPYLLLFQLSHDEIVKRVAERVAKQMNLEIVEVLSSSETVKNKKCLTSEGPLSFLSLIKDANYVVTSSFHGTAFSILFEKNFNTVYLDVDTSERMINLLTQLELSERLVESEDNIVTDAIDYHKVNEKLEPLRASSKSFLYEALS